MTKSADLPPPPDDYFLEIEALFSARRGTPFLFSAKDWDLIRRWKDTGIPLPIVVEAINTCFDRREKAPRPRAISSLSFCRRAVEELWQERRDLHVGAEGTVPELAPREGLIALRDELIERASVTDHAPLKESLEGAAARISELAGHSVPELEEALITIEEELFDGLDERLPARLSDRVAAKLESSLEGVEFKDRATRDRTRAANLRRILRRELDLPRLTLLG